MSVEARKRLFTVDEFHRMGEAGILDGDARLELLGGEIFEMPPIGSEHQGDVNALTSLLVRSLGDRAVVAVQGPVVLDDFSEPLPDVVVLHPRKDFYRGANPRPEEVLLLIEVADTSLTRDRRDKLPRYAAAGILEVWILDVRRRWIAAHRDPSEDTYTSTAVYAPGDTLSPVAFPDVALDVGELLG